MGSPSRPSRRVVRAGGRRAPGLYRAPPTPLRVEVIALGSVLTLMSREDADPGDVAITVTVTDSVGRSTSVTFQSDGAGDGVHAARLLLGGDEKSAGPSGGYESDRDELALNPE